MAVYDMVFSWTCILPNQNLVSNQGFGSDATHTIELTAQANLNTIPLKKITHPTTRSVAIDADNFTFKAMFFVPLWKRIVLKLSAIITKLWK